VGSVAGHDDRITGRRDATQDPTVDDARERQRRAGSRVECADRRAAGLMALGAVRVEVGAGTGFDWPGRVSRIGERGQSGGTGRRRR
jgi:hypothetical protein